ncbi:hypothetical protein HZS_866 [Henneguya salminicola]|nr:hypothetical protein HZS_866 [Henneguya salminicola]
MILLFHKRKRFPCKLKSSVKNIENTWVLVVYNAIILWVSVYFSLLMWVGQTYHTIMHFNSPYDAYYVCHFTNYVYCETLFVAPFGRSLNCSLLINNPEAITCSNLGDNLYRSLVCTINYNNSFTSCRS